MDVVKRVEKELMKLGFCAEEEKKSETFRARNTGRASPVVPLTGLVSSVCLPKTTLTNGLSVSAPLRPLQPSTNTVSLNSLRFHSSSSERYRSLCLSVVMARHSRRLLAWTRERGRQK